MRRYAAIRLCFAVLLMEAWILLCFFQPYGFLRFLIWAGGFWAITPIHKVRNKRSTPILTQIAGWLAGICAFVIYGWQAYQLDGDKLDVPTTLCFGLLFVACGLHSWQGIKDASDETVDEVFGNCLGASSFNKQKTEQAGGHQPPTRPEST